jgi:metal-responsive CopG/Arc/MetJ family transcriptional regulator
MKKDAQLLVKLDKELKKEFNDLCKELDTSTSRQVRHLIRDFLKEHNKENK